MATSTPLFIALSSAKFTYKYDVLWAELPAPEFNIKTKAWLKLLGKLIGGVSSKERKALAQEFLQFLYVYKQTLEKLTRGTHSPEPAQVMQKMNDFNAEYKRQFGALLDMPLLRLPSELASIADKMVVNAVRRELIVRKKQLVKYWMDGLRDFPEHKDDVSLMLQYMGNNEPAKVRVFLDVLCKDLTKIRFNDPRPWLQTSSQVETGLMRGGEDGKFGKVTWTNDEFKKAVKAEVSAGYGVKASGECVLEITGLRAEFKADAFVGVSASAEGEATYVKGKGVEVKASVEAMVGVKIKVQANIDVADIFLIEASAEAFAGAMASAEVEFVATVDGVKLDIKAEAFAGARIKGEASLSLRMCGYDIIKGTAKGSLSVGVGASFGLEFESSAFGGSKLGIEADVTVGVGAGGGAEVTVYQDNLGRAFNSLFYSGYLTMLGRSGERDTWRTYFRDLEDNQLLFERADKIIDEALIGCYIEYQTYFTQLQSWKQMEALSCFKANKAIPGVIAL
ncbi:MULTISPECIES: hypothetical protein [unclassified Variovorax]|uniref:hypothetical protein n=1 Tax=unclassified Variovorax TaxID=663243 RepID=UPI003F47EF9B